MTLYEKNLAYFKAENEYVYNILTAGNPLYFYKLEKVKDSFNYIIENETSRCFMHSVYDTNEEIKRMFQYTPKDTETMVVFGLGCGYALDYIAEHYKNINKLVIVEPCLDMFKNLLENIDMLKYVNTFKTITFGINQDVDEMSEILCGYLSKNLKMSIVYNMSYRTIFNEYYESMTKRISKTISEIRVNAATNTTFLFQWLKNYMFNLNENCMSIESLKDLFKGRPVVIVAAGPSLNKNIHLIKEIKNKAIVVAVGTAITILENNEIEPHFRMAIDGSLEEKRTIFDVVNSKIPLIFADKLYCEILPSYEGHKIRFVIDSDYMVNYLYNKKEIEYNKIRTGPSVANSAVDLFCKLGCSKVIFLGQDLAYTEDGIYAKGAINNEEMSKTKLEKYIKMKDIYGNDAYTITQFLAMKYIFEIIIKNYPDMKFINATEGGIGIDGTEIKTLEQTIQEDLKDEIKINIEECIKEAYENNDQYMEKIKDALSEFKKELQEVIALNANRMELLKDTMKKIKRGLNSQRLLNDLEYIVRLDSEYEEKEIYIKAILPALAETIRAVNLNFQYTGSDKQKQVEYRSKSVKSSIVLINEYAKIAKLYLDGIMKENQK
ncbi:motility associated factor glycosyltransferase family protein [Crassaminicella profunda]|uniref:motility associated factor glycosyltransferase family protein n=1 Tax=Crassaminicella profunda TaxID=1286698 RepID=UPI001CA787B2|nr:6-hydroxymethylpterin diphosphokinase MptE-like protein [Crassaminicella profunda]QZY54314.1 DUF115 domain-containing protein [Crassaminicella profunda]